MDKKTHSPTERDLVFDWTDKWLELVGLINKVTDLEEIRYQSLRFWFMDHQAEFLPLWADFYECQE